MLDSTEPVKTPESRILEHKSLKAPGKPAFALGDFDAGGHKTKSPLRTLSVQILLNGRPLECPTTAAVPADQRENPPFREGFLNLRLDGKNGLKTWMKARIRVS